MPSSAYLIDGFPRAVD